ncbi:MAG: permease [Gemmatimonadetes bacterium]|nr:permease [Gemmatimonadota bacterium]
MPVEESAPGFASSYRRQVMYSVAVLLVLIGALVAYKGGAALTVLADVRRTGILRLDTDLALGQDASSLVGTLARSIRYLAIVAPALVFGVLIAAAVRTFVSPRWLVQAFGREPVREQVIAGVAGAPLMLCSCCVAPVFSAVYERSARLAPSLGVALAAPSLNPAALLLTFMLFPGRIATSRLAMALAAVFLVAPLVARLGSRVTPEAAAMPGVQFACPTSRGWSGFLASCLHVTTRTVPLIFAGVVASFWLAERLPLDVFASQTVSTSAVLLASIVAVPLALPTFFEIPLALTLIGVGAPAGVAAAVLFAGPAVNLPSLVTIARSTNWKVAGLLALAVALVAGLGGLLVG